MNNELYLQRLEAKLPENHAIELFNIDFVFTEDEFETLYDWIKRYNDLFYRDRSKSINIGYRKVTKRIIIDFGLVASISHDGINKGKTVIYLRKCDNRKRRITKFRLN